jgi:hypothetical protein
MEEEVNVASLETKNIRQDSVLEKGGENIEKKPIINVYLQMILKVGNIIGDCLKCFFNFFHLFLR